MYEIGSRQCDTHDASCFSVASEARLCDNAASMSRLSSLAGLVDESALLHASTIEHANSR